MSAKMKKAPSAGALPKVIMLRMEPELFAAIQIRLARRRREQPGVQFSTSSLLRQILYHELAAEIEADAAGPRPKNNRSKATPPTEQAEHAKPEQAERSQHPEQAEPIDLGGLMFIGEEP